MTILARVRGSALRRRRCSDTGACDTGDEDSSSGNIAVEPSWVSNGELEFRALPRGGLENVKVDSMEGELLLVRSRGVFEHSGKSFWCVGVELEDATVDNGLEKVKGELFTVTGSERLMLR